jgi:hypothetical protein
MIIVMCPTPDRASRMVPDLQAAANRTGDLVDFRCRHETSDTWSGHPPIAGTQEAQKASAKRPDP